MLEKPEESRLFSGWTAGFCLCVLGRSLSYCTGRTLVDACSTVDALACVDNCHVIDRYCILGANICACSARYTLCCIYFWYFNTCGQKLYVSILTFPNIDCMRQYAAPVTFQPVRIETPYGKDLVGHSSYLQDDGRCAGPPTGCRFLHPLQSYFFCFCCSVVLTINSVFA